MTVPIFEDDLATVILKHLTMGYGPGHPPTCQCKKKIAHATDSGRYAAHALHIADEIRKAGFEMKP